MVGAFLFYLFFSRTLTIQSRVGDGKAIFLILLYTFHLLHRHLDISQSIIAEILALEWQRSS